MRLESGPCPRIPRAGGALAPLCSGFEPQGPASPHCSVWRKAGGVIPGWWPEDVPLDAETVGASGVMTVEDYTNVPRGC